MNENKIFIDTALERGENMKYLTQNWDKKYDGVLYFLQRLQEMLFHYSDDIVKVPIHNTATLIIEYIEIDNDTTIENNHKDFIAAELIQSINTDEIVKEKIGTEFIKLITKSIKQNQRETVYYLREKIGLADYYRWCVDYIKKNICEAKNKNEICSGLHKWVASIMSAGYSSTYVYRFLQSMFKNDVEDPLNASSILLEHFSFHKEKYRVYFLFMSNLENYKELLSKRLEIDFVDDGKFSKLNKKDNKAFVGFVDIDAIDPYSAVEIAYGKINIFISFYRVISNRKKVLLGKNSFVRNTNIEEEIYIPVISDGYKTIEVEPQMDLRKAIDSAVLGCQDKIGYEKLKKIITLHNMALNQIDYDDGFVNLWSIMEVASCDSTGKSKIDKVIQSVLPILQNDYFKKYFQAINNDLRQSLPREEYRNTIDTITEDGSNEFKIACLALLKKYKNERESLFLKLGRYPNIRQRIYKMYCLKDDKSAIFKLSEDYAQRIKWHIYRLYRVRNGIVHAGEQDRNVRTLGEHLHIYCDGIIHEMITKLASDYSLLTIQDVLMDTRLLMESKKALFSQVGGVEVQDVRNLFFNYFREACMRN